MPPYQPLLKQLEPLHMLPISPFHLGYSRLQTTCIPNSKTLGFDPWCFLPEAPGRAILPGCGVEHILYILSCPDWPEGYCTTSFLSDLFKGLSLLTTLPKIVLLSGHLIEGIYKLTITWIMHSVGPLCPRGCQQPLPVLCHRQTSLVFLPVLHPSHL